MENTKELQKSLQKRNFYTTKDSANVFLYALLLPLAVSFLFAFVLVSFLPKDDPNANVLQIILDKYLWVAILMTMITQIVFACLYFVYNKASRIQQRSCNISFKKANVWTVILSCFMGIVSVFGFIWLVEFCFGGLWETIGISTEGFALPLNNIGWLFANLLLLGVVPAICEELLFRGIIFQGLKEKFSPFLSCVLTALLFALMHQNIVQFIYPLILGFVLSLVMHRTNNLLYPILIHLFNNFTTIILTYLMNIGVINLSINLTWWFVLIAIVVAAITGLVWWLIDKFYLSKHKKIEVEKQGEVYQTSPISFGKFPLTMIIGVLLSIVMIVINAV